MASHQNSIPSHSWGPDSDAIDQSRERTCTSFWSRNETATFISVKSFKSTSSSIVGLQLAVQRFARPLPLQKNLTYHTIHAKRKWCTSGPVGKPRLSCYGTSHNQWTHEPAPSHVSNVTFSASVSTGGGTIFGCTAGTVRGGPSGASVGVAGGVLWGVWGPPRCGPSITRAASPAHRDGGDVPTM